MQNPLPANLCLRQWFASKQSYDWQNSACDPDRWRQPGGSPDPAAEAPRHYLEIDYAMPISGYPREYAEVVTFFGSFAPKNGQVPWRVEEMYGRLVAAFQAPLPHDAAYENEILKQAFWLSHYVTDSYSVLHNTKNFDPNNGLHSRWESDMLSTNAENNAIQVLAEPLYGTPGIVDPRNNTFDAVIVGNGVVPALIAADRAASGDGGVFNAGTYQMSVLFEQSKDLTSRRWADALTVLSSMLWTAWAQAGRPELAGFSNDCSRAPPTGEIVLKGFPVPGGFTHPGDGGVVLPSYDAGVVDSGVIDAGVDRADAGARDAGSATGGGSGGGGGMGPEDPGGCSCTQAPGLMLAALAMALIRRRRST